MTEPTILKCRLCDYRVSRWTTRKNGTRRHGSSRLLGHIVACHEQAYRSLLIQQEQDWNTDPLTLSDGCPFCGDTCAGTCPQAARIRVTEER